MHVLSQKMTNTLISILKIKYLNIAKYVVSIIKNHIRNKDIFLQKDIEKEYQNIKWLKYYEIDQKDLVNGCLSKNVNLTLVDSCD